MDERTLRSWLDTVRPDFDGIRKERRQHNAQHAPDLNVFQMLGVEEKETSHSSFLASLLDPLGNHGQGDTFLRSFLLLLGVSFDPASSPMSWHVRTEEPCEGGQLDLTLRSAGIVIVIENKIHAREGSYQLDRYDTWLKPQSRKKDTLLVYLTRDGRGARSLDDTRYKKLSYTELSKWLTRLAADPSVVRAESLRELLRQYIRIINQLTGEGEKPKVDERFIALLVKPENVQLALEIGEALSELRREIQKRFWARLIDSISDRLGDQRNDWKIELEPETQDKPYIYAFPKELGDPEPRLFFCVQHVPDRAWEYYDEHSGVAWSAKKAVPTSETPAVTRLRQNLQAVGYRYRTGRDWLSWQSRRLSLRSHDPSSLPPIQDPSWIDDLAEQMATLMHAYREGLVAAVRSLPG